MQVYTRELNPRLRPGDSHTHITTFPAGEIHFSVISGPVSPVTVRLSFPSIQDCFLPCHAAIPLPDPPCLAPSRPCSRVSICNTDTTTSADYLSLRPLPSTPLFTSRVNLAAYAYAYAGRYFMPEYLICYQLPYVEVGNIYGFTAVHLHTYLRT